MTFEQINILATFLTSAGTFFIAWRAWDTQKTNNSIYIDELISSSLDKFTEIGKMKIEYKDKDLDNDQNYQELFNSALENIVNAYETACAYYIKKGFLGLFTVIDRGSFINTRRTEILQLVKSEQYKLILKDRDRSDYKWIWQAYDEFNR
jgi:hypothetical protein